MRTLQLEDLRENPRTVVLRPLPERPTRFLLILAQIAATCCRQIAEETIAELEVARGDTYPLCQELRTALDDWHCAHRKIGEICFALRDDFGVPVFDFSMSRDRRR
jgi:hypothetical protein